MINKYRWADHHVFDVEDGAILLGVEHASIFAIDAPTRDVMKRWVDSDCVDMEQIPAADREVLEGLKGSLILEPVQPGRRQAAETLDPRDVPLITMVLDVAQDCNLRCRYCYADGGSYGAEPRLLDTETARKAVRHLIEASAEQKEVTLILFGGEPLLNMPAVKAAVEELEKQAALADKKAVVSLTTNGTLLNAETVAYLHKHKVSVALSLDGPIDLHDANRSDACGKGTYNKIVAQLPGLLQGSPNPVAARVTLLPEQWARIEEVFWHLLELGFHEVGIAPASPVTKAMLPDAEQEDLLFQGFEALGRRFVAAAKKGRILPFTNLIDLLGRLHVGQAKHISCGAGLGYLAVDAVGDFFLCHRLTGEELFMSGDLDNGRDAERITSCLDHVTAGKKEACSKCWARTLCSGGCHYENYIRETKLGLPFGSNCSFVLRWLQLGIELYVELRNSDADALLDRLGKRISC